MTVHQWLLGGWRADSSSLAVLLTVANMVLKPVTLLSALGQLRQRGEPTFSMPGGFPFGNQSNQQCEFARPSLVTMSGNTR